MLVLERAWLKEPSQTATLNAAGALPNDETNQTIPGSRRLGALGKLLAFFKNCPSEECSDWIGMVGGKAWLKNGP
jgi:hypothetical protein